MAKSNFFPSSWKHQPTTKGLVTKHTRLFLLEYCLCSATFLSISLFTKTNQSWTNWFQQISGWFLLPDSHLLFFSHFKCYSKWWRHKFYITNKNLKTAKCGKILFLFILLREVSQCSNSSLNKKKHCQNKDLVSLTQIFSVTSILATVSALRNWWQLQLKSPTVSLSSTIVSSVSMFSSGKILPGKLTMVLASQLSRFQWKCCWTWSVEKKRLQNLVTQKIWSMCPLDFAQSGCFSQHSHL